MSRDAPSVPGPTIWLCQSDSTSAMYFGCYGPRRGANTLCRAAHTGHCHGEPVSLFFLCLYVKLHFTDDEKWNIGKHGTEVKNSSTHIAVRLIYSSSPAFPVQALLPRLEHQSSFLLLAVIAVVVETASSSIFVPLLQADGSVPQVLQSRGDVG